MLKIKRYGTVLLILFLALASYFWLSTTISHKHKQSAAPTAKKNDSKLFLLFSKSPSYQEIYKGIVLKTHSPDQAKAFISYLKAMRQMTERTFINIYPYLLKAGNKEWQALLGYAESRSNPVDGREVVWNQLSSEQKVRINGSWEDASVSTLIFHKNMIESQKSQAYDGKEVVVMSFPTKDNSLKESKHMS